MWWGVNGAGVTVIGTNPQTLVPARSMVQVGGEWLHVKEEGGEGTLLYVRNA